MTSSDVNYQPSFLGIQISNGDVIPIEVRYVGKNKIVFSIPIHNSKQKYMVSGYIGNDIDVNALKTTLGPFVIHFTEEEEVKLSGNTQYKTENQNFQNSDNASHVLKHTKNYNYNTVPNKNVSDLNSMSTSRKRSQEDISSQNIPQKIFRDDLGNRQTDNINFPETSESQVNAFMGFNPMRKVDYGYKVPTNISFQDQDDFFMHQPIIHLEEPKITDMQFQYQGVSDKAEYAHHLLTKGYELYESDRFNGEINEKALNMLRDSQIIYNELYPESFSRIVLPGTNHQVIRRIDPDAFMMSPRQFRRFFKRRLELAKLRKVGLIRERTHDVMYPIRQKAAKGRVRDKFGTFL